MALHSNTGKFRPWNVMTELLMSERHIDIQCRAVHHFFRLSCFTWNLNIRARVLSPYHMLYSWVSSFIFIDLLLSQLGQQKQLATFCLGIFCWSENYQSKQFPYVLADKTASEAKSINICSVRRQTTETRHKHDHSNVSTLQKHKSCVHGVSQPITQCVGDLFYHAFSPCS